MPGESSSESGNPYGRMHVTEPVRATIPVQNGTRLSWDGPLRDEHFDTVAIINRHKAVHTFLDNMFRSFSIQVQHKDTVRTNFQLNFIDLGYETSAVNPLSAAGFDALPLKVKFIIIKLAEFVLCSASPLQIERLTSAIRRLNPRIGQFLPLWCPVRLQICLSGCQHSPQLPIVDRRSPIDHRTLSNFRSVFDSVKATPSLYFAFHSTLHHFQRHQ